MNWKTLLKHPDRVPGEIAKRFDAIAEKLKGQSLISSIHGMMAVAITLGHISYQESVDLLVPLFWSEL